MDKKTDVRRPRNSDPLFVVLSVLTVGVLLLYVPYMAFLTRAMVHSWDAAMGLPRDGTRVRGLESEAAVVLWAAAVPLIALNLAWMVYGLLCWRNQPASAGQEAAHVQARGTADEIGSPTTFRRP